MTKGQEHLLKLLKEIDQICRENNIQYFCAGGTLIGAVRHRGFVPWDDDADLYMTRDNFLKFLKVAKDGKFPPDRELGCQELDRRYFNVFARYIDTSSTAIHKAQIITEDAAGEVVDILQLDPIPQDKYIQRKHFKRLLIYSDLVNEATPYFHRRDGEYLYYWYYRLLQRLIGKEKVLSRLEKKMFCYKEADCDCYFMRWGGTPLIFSKEMFAEEEYVPFEDTNLAIPRLYNDYLIYHYGEEWANVPNVSEQMSHVAVHCPNVEYSKVRNTYCNVIDTQRVCAGQMVYKNSKIKRAKSRHLNVDKLTILRGIKVVEELKQTIKSKGIDVQELYAAAEYDKLSGIFSSYYNWQGHSVVSGRDTYVGLYRYSNPILLELPLPLLVIALKTQVDIGRASKAFRTIEIFQSKKGYLPNELKDILDEIETMRKADTEFSLGKYENAMRLADIVLKNNLNNKSAIILKIKCMMKIGKGAPEIQELLHRGLKVFPNDVELKKLNIDITCGPNVENIYKKYLKIKNNVVNGFTRMDIKEVERKYTEELLVRMRKAEQAGQYKEIKKIYEKVTGLNLLPDEVIECINFLINADMTDEDALALYRDAVACRGTSDIDKQREVCKKLLILAGEEPLIADVHVEVVFSKNDKITKDCIDKAAQQYSELKRDDLFYQVQKYFADLLCSEMNIKEAYELYRVCIEKIPTNTIAYNDLFQRFKEDAMQIGKLREVGAEKMYWNKLRITFESEENYNMFMKRVEM